MADEEGFEPSGFLDPSVFKTAAFSHSATRPFYVYNYIKVFLKYYLIFKKNKLSNSIIFEIFCEVVSIKYIRNCR